MYQVVHSLWEEGRAATARPFALQQRPVDRDAPVSYLSLRRPSCFPLSLPGELILSLGSAQGPHHHSHSLGKSFHKNEIATPSSTPHPGLHILKSTGIMRSPLSPHLVFKNHTRHSHSLQVRHLLDIQRLIRGNMRLEIVISESYLQID